MEYLIGPKELIGMRMRTVHSIERYRFRRRTVNRIDIETIKYEYVSMNIAIESSCDNSFDWGLVRTVGYTH